MAGQSESREQWERTAAELRAYRDAQRRAWGDFDDIKVARYLVGASSPQERAEVEQAVRSLPDLRDVMGVLRTAVPFSGEGPVAQPGPAGVPAAPASRWSPVLG